MSFNPASLLIAATASALVANGTAVLACGEGDVKCATKVVVVADGQGDGQALHDELIVGAGGEGAMTFVFEADEDTAPDGQKKFVFYTGEGDNKVIELAGDAVFAAADPNHGWLGVSLGEVTPALAAQLSRGEGGILITNVVEDSPAGQAGLERYDIVTAVNGVALDGSISGLSDAIGDAGKGAQIKLDIVRQGRPQSITATLGSRPQDLSWVHEIAGVPSIHERFRTIGKIARLGPDGELVFEDLGDLKELADLPDSIRALIPDIDDVMTNVWVEANGGDVSKHVVTKMIRDGQTIEIEQEGNGVIVIRRTDEDGNTTEERYDSAEELEAADADAYESYSNIQNRHVFELHLDSLPDMGAFHFKNGAFTDLKGLSEITIDIDDSLDAAKDAYQTAMKTIQVGPMGKHGFFFGTGDQVMQHFNVASDGTIEVRTRKGDSEVVQNYADEDDLRDRNPEMYEKYFGVLESKD